MAKNGAAYANAMANGTGGLANHPTANKIWFVMVEEAEVDYDPTDEIADLTRVGTEVLTKTSATCSARAISCGAKTFAAVTGGHPKAIVALSDTPAGSPLVIGIQDVNGGDVFDMDTLGPLAADSLTILHHWNGET